MSELANPVLTLTEVRKRRALTDCEPLVVELKELLRESPHPSPNDLKTLVGRFRSPVLAHLTAGVVDGMARHGYDAESIALCREDVEALVDDEFLTFLIGEAIEDVDLAAATTFFIIMSFGSFVDARDQH